MNPDRLLQHFDRISEAPDAIPRLRRFILDLAVRGKLVEQDPNDEPAAELLKRIQREKERLVKEGEIKKLEKFAPVEAGEIPFAIPSSWQIIRMGWLARKLGAGSTPLGGKTVYQSEGVPFLRSQNVYNNGLRLDDVALIPRAVHERMSGTHVQQHDVLLNITGASIGRCALVPSPFIEANVSQHVAIIRLFAPEIRTFVHLSLTSPFFQKLIDDVQVGVSREGLSMQRLKFFPMPLSPLAEQHRIVVKVDELMALCDQLEAAKTEREQSRDRLVAASLHRLNSPAGAEEANAPEAFRDRARFYFNHLPRLTTRPEHIKQLRQTILNLAVRGKLVPRDPNDEPAAELLKRIQAEKERLVKAGRIRASKPTRSESPINGRELPPTWSLSSLDDIIDPMRPASYGVLVPGGHDSNGVPLIRVADLDAFNPSSHPEKSIDRTIAQQYQRVELEGDEIFVGVVGSIGKVGIAHPNWKGAVVARAVCRFAASNVVLRRFLVYSLLSDSAQNYFAEATRTLAQPTLNIGLIRALPIPLPPFAEQHRIVAKVDELMVLCDQLEAQLTTTEADSRRLLEAVLHEALAQD
jgi:type I restriction enzyme S subunit